MDKIKSYIKPKEQFIDYGKVPPQAIDIEQLILGALLLDGNKFDEIQDQLKPEFFYKENHKLIYQALQSLRNATEKQPIDISTVCHQLIKNGTIDQAGGAFYISSLTDRIGSSANIETHIKIISEKFIKREIIRTSQENIKNSYDDSIDCFDLISTANKNLTDIQNLIPQKSILKIGEQADDFWKDFHIRQEKKSFLSGIPSGFNDLDNKTLGWQKKNMITIAARASHGKTSLALSMARNAALLKHPVAFFSLEMGVSELYQRLISIETGVPLENVRRADVDKNQYKDLHDGTYKMNDLPLYIDDTATITMPEIGAKLRKLIRLYGIQMAFIDYLQLVTPNDKKAIREQQVGQISRDIKLLAKDCDIPIMPLAQLNRDIEKRTNKTPVLADLRESGSIEMDSDIVIFIYQPKLFGMEDIAGESTNNLGILDIAKYKNGTLGDMELYFDYNTASFRNQNSHYDNVQISPAKPVDFSQSKIAQQNDDIPF